MSEDQREDLHALVKGLRITHPPQPLGSTSDLDPIRRGPRAHIGMQVLVYNFDGYADLPHRPRLWRMSDAPFVATVAFVDGPRVNLAGWDHAGQPFAARGIPFGPRPTPLFASIFCTPA